METDKIKLNISNCNECPLHKSRNKVAIGEWNIKAKAMFVGLAPGRLGADQTGIPFTKDRSGKFFRELLEKNNVQKNLIDITNLVRCNPKDKNRNNRTPYPDEIKQCSKYLIKEISLIKPKIIVTLGHVVTEYLLGRKIKNFKELHGKMIKNKNLTILPLYHPSYIINYNGYSKESYEKDFKRLADSINLLQE